MENPGLRSSMTLITIQNILYTICMFNIQIAEFHSENLDWVEWVYDIHFTVNAPLTAKLYKPLL